VDLEGKVAIVTGGAVRLGKALALALAKHGAHVAVHYGGSADAAEETATQIKSVGREAIAIQADLAQTRQVSNVLQRAIQHFGQVDILVNSAAIFEPGDWAETTEEQWDKHFSINLKSPFFLSQAFAAHIGPERKGHIINISDWRATRPRADYVAYTLTKAALITLTKSLALALAPNIAVNTIAPGAILPPPGQDQTYLERIGQAIPARRAGSPEEVSKAMLYLLDADFVTGELIFVTGGQHL